MSEKPLVETSEADFTKDGEAEAPESKRTLTRSDIINAYRVAEFVTLARDGSPVCWPLFPGFESGRLTFNTGYVYPTKARNAQRNPRVAALFSDPTASSRSDDDPLMLVRGWRKSSIRTCNGIPSATSINSCKGDRR